MSLAEYKTQLIPYLKGEGSIKDFANGMLQNFIAIPEDYNFAGFEIKFLESVEIEARNSFSDIPLGIGTVITQHSTKEPIRITLQGSVYNITYDVSKIEQLAAKVQDKIGILNVYASDYVGPVLKKYNETKTAIQGGLSYVDTLVADGNSLAKSFNATTDIKKSNIFNVISQCLQLRNEVKIIEVKVLGVETSHFKRMVVESVNIDSKPSKTKDVANFRIVFKEYLEAKNYDLKTIDNNKINRLIRYQTEPQNNKGLVNGVKEEASALYNLFKK